MEVKGKFKNTDIGVVPSDWLLLSYGQIFNFLSTATYSRSQLSDSHEIKYIHYGDIHTLWHHFLDLNSANLPSISNEQLKQYSLIEEGDIVMADASEDYSGIGKSVEVRNLNNIKVVSGLHTFLLRDTKKVFVDGFRGYIHSNSIVKTQFDRLATGMKVYGVSKSNLKNVLVPVPPKPEQTAIATALSDTDDLISSLEKLIAKKRAIKQGAMQELLRPKEGWEVKKLADVVFVNMGQSPDSVHYNIDGQGLPLIQGNADIEKRKQIVRYWTRQITKVCNSGDLIMTVRAPVGAIGIATEKSCIGRGVCSFRPTAIDKDFLFHLMIYKEGDWKILEQGSTFTAANSCQIVQFGIAMPKTSEEQSRIAGILSDMDKELVSLEEKLDKYKHIQQGMMQQLLTGKIRLMN